MELKPLIDNDATEALPVVLSQSDMNKDIILCTLMLSFSADCNYSEEFYKNVQEQLKLMTTAYRPPAHLINLMRKLLLENEFEDYETWTRSMNKLSKQVKRKDS